MTDPYRSPDPAGDRPFDDTRASDPAPEAPAGTHPPAHRAHPPEHDGHLDDARHRRPAAEPRRSAGVSAGVWIALILGAVILVLLLIFIIQNNVTAQFQYFGWEFSLPLGVAMLLAAIAGILVAGLAGSVRIAVLSRRLKKANRSLAEVERILDR